MNSNSYIYTFTLIMTTLVAVVLGLMFYGLKGIHAQNEAVFNKRAILAAVGNYLPKGVDAMSDQEVQAVFDQQITSYVIKSDGTVIEDMVADQVDMAKERKKPESDRVFPLYVFNDGKENFYIMSVRGNGLWDEIWGNIALKSDLNTVAGASFDHKGETPGLGAEIKDNPKFSAQFEGKQIYDYNGTYTSVLVRKGGAQDPKHEVDGISGATVTANGVSEMINRGISYYLPYLKTIKAQNQGGQPLGMLNN